MISPLSNDPNSLHVANFSGEIKKPEDIADMLLMILPYAYNLDLKTIVGTVGKLKTGCLTLCKKHDAILCIGPYPHCSRIPRNGVSSTCCTDNNLPATGPANYLKTRAGDLD